MTHPALPDNWEELMADYVLGNLDPDDAKEFDYLLETHPQVMTEVAQLQEVLHLIPYAAAERPPAHLRSSVLEAALKTDQDSPNETGRPAMQREVVPKRSPQPAQPTQISKHWLRSSTGLRTSIAAAAAVMAFLLGIDNYRLRQELQNVGVVTQALKQPDTVIETLTGDNNAAGRVVIDTQQQQLVVLVQDLPPLPEGQVYRLWAVADETVNYWGEFETNITGAALTNLTIPSAQPNLSGIKLLITIESSASPPTPQGPVVMQNSL